MELDVVAALVPVRCRADENGEQCEDGAMTDFSASASSSTGLADTSWPIPSIGAVMRDTLEDWGMG